jgi:hypothetical protein
VYVCVGWGRCFGIFVAPFVSGCTFNMRGIEVCMYVYHHFRGSCCLEVVALADGGSCCHGPKGISSNFACDSP